MLWDNSFTLIDVETGTVLVFDNTNTVVYYVNTLLIFSVVLVKLGFNYKEYVMMC